MRTWDEILADRSHGATYLLEEVLDRIEAHLARGTPVPDDLADRLIGAHPGMACFHVLKARLASGVTAAAVNGVREQMCREEAAVTAMFRSSLPREVTAIAVLSHSAMVVACLASLPVRDLVVTCALSWPAGEGRVMASELARAGVREVRLVPDGHFYSTISTQHALVLGCDAWSDTRFINKSGSGAAVHLAQDAGVPVWVVPGPLRRVREETMDALPLKTMTFPPPVPAHPAIRPECPLLERVSRQGVHLLEPADAGTVDGGSPLPDGAVQ